MDREKIENDLLNSGFPDMQSEALSYLFAEMATKEDIRELRSEMRGEFRAVRSEMHGEFRAIRSEMQGEFRAVRAELRAAIADSGKQLMEANAAYQNKLFTHVLALIGALTAIMTLLLLLIR